MAVNYLHRSFSKIPEMDAAFCQVSCEGADHLLAGGNYLVIIVQRMNGYVRKLLLLPPWLNQENWAG